VRLLAAAAGVVIVAGVIALEASWRADEQARLRAGVEAKGAEVEALALLDQARQRLRVPTEGRQRETQDLLRQAARLWNRGFPQDRKDALNLELRSLYAASLGVPELDVTAVTEVSDPERDFMLAWPAAIHPDGESMAVGTRARPVRWVRGEQIAIPPGEAPVGRGPMLAYSRDGKWLAFASAAGGLEVWDGEVTCVVQRLESPSGGDPGAVVALHFTPDGATLWARRDDGQVRSWSLPGIVPGARWRLTAGPQRITAAAFDPAGESLGVGDSQGRVRLCNAGGGFSPERLPGGIAVSRSWRWPGVLTAACLPRARRTT
jgi:hypothetical protein